MTDQLTVTEWYGCYSKTWNGTLVPEAYSHPAKVTAGLARRIYEHMLMRGYIKPGDHIVDPFGGVAGFAYHAMLNGLHWHGIELEPRFVQMGTGVDCAGYSKNDWRRYYGRANKIRRDDLCPACRNAINAKPKPQKAGHGRQADLFSRASRPIPCATAHHYT
ncbi:MAG: site-specific DNA-methyltransferase, partial [Anaerolineae bacterium]|nr:site-specific DNA-methyltransferase [Anaerolineae bacterium]